MKISVTIILGPLHCYIASVSLPKSGLQFRFLKGEKMECRMFSPIANPQPTSLGSNVIQLVWLKWLLILGCFSIYVILLRIVEDY